MRNPIKVVRDRVRDRRIERTSEYLLAMQEPIERVIGHYERITGETVARLPSSSLTFARFIEEHPDAPRLLLDHGVSLDELRFPKRRLRK